MSDIVERLRSAGDRDEGRPYSTMHEAADEIERLRAALRPLLEHYLNCYEGNEDELAKDARAALEEKP